MSRQLVSEAVCSGRVTPIDSMAPLSEADIGEASHLVGQMATEAFCRALQAEADVVIAGRAYAHLLPAGQEEAIKRFLSHPG